MFSRRPSALAADLIRLFHITPSDARRADGVFTTVVVPEGTALSTEGGTTKQLVLLLDGKVTVSRGGEVIIVLGPGSVIGEITALGVRDEQTATAVASSECKVAVASRTDFHKIKDVTSLFLHMHHLVSVRTLSTTA